MLLYVTKTWDQKVGMLRLCVLTLMLAMRSWVCAGFIVKTILWQSCLMGCVFSLQVHYILSSPDSWCSIHFHLTIHFPRMRWITRVSLAVCHDSKTKLTSSIVPQVGPQKVEEDRCGNVPDVNGLCIVCSFVVEGKCYFGNCEVLSDQLTTQQTLLHMYTIWQRWSWKLIHSICTMIV